MAFSNRYRWLVLTALTTAGMTAAQRSHQVSPADLRRDFLRKFVAAAIERTHHSVRYDPAYVRIPYPGGDVPAATGTCTDEVIRSFARWASTCKRTYMRT